jgi:hypothetical protein
MTQPDRASSAADTAANSTGRPRTWFQGRRKVIAIIVATAVVLGGIGSGIGAAVNNATVLQAQKDQEARELRSALIALGGVQASAITLHDDLEELIRLSPEDSAELKTANDSLATSSASRKIRTVTASEASARRIADARSAVASALKGYLAASDLRVAAVVAAAPLADVASHDAVTTLQKAVTQAITDNHGIHGSVVSLNTALAALRASQGQGLAAQTAAAEAAAAARNAGGSTSNVGTKGSTGTKGGSSGGRGSRSGGGSPDGSGSIGGGAGGGVPVVDHTPRVVANGQHVASCVGGKAYSQSTSSAGTIIIDVPYSYYYTTFSTPDGWGLTVYGCF